MAWILAQELLQILDLIDTFRRNHWCEVPAKEALYILFLNDDAEAEPEPVESETFEAAGGLTVVVDIENNTGLVNGIEIT